VLGSCGSRAGGSTSSSRRALAKSGDRRAVGPTAPVGSRSAQLGTASRPPASDRSSHRLGTARDRLDDPGLGGLHRNLALRRRLRHPSDSAVGRVEAIVYLVVTRSSWPVRRRDPEELAISRVLATLATQQSLSSAAPPTARSMPQLQPTNWPLTPTSASIYSGSARWFTIGQDPASQVQFSYDTPGSWSDPSSPWTTLR
jgi:hypothetical protein